MRRSDVGISGKVAQSCRAVRGVGSEFAVDGVERKRAIGGLQIDDRRFRRANKEIHGPIALTARSVCRDLAILNGKGDLRQHSSRASIFIGSEFARPDRIVVFIPAFDLNAAIRMWTNAKSGGFGLG